MKKSLVIVVFLVIIGILFFWLGSKAVESLDGLSYDQYWREQAADIERMLDYAHVDYSEIPKNITPKERVKYLKKISKEHVEQIGAYLNGGDYIDENGNLVHIESDFIYESTRG